MGWSILSGFPNLQRQKLMADAGVQPFIDGGWLVEHHSSIL